MLSMVDQKNASAGEMYYTEHFQKDEYHQEKGSVKGEWYGKDAARLGLVGELRQEDYVAVLNNRYPVGHAKAGERITVRHRTTQYYDMTFNMPKDVSLLAMRDERIKALVMDAVREQLALVERMTETRIRKGADVLTQNRRVTGSMAASLFMHESSRANDPHLHVHTVIHNLTFDPVEQRFKAIQELPFYRNQKLFDRAVLNDVAGRLQKLGYEIETTPEAFAIKGVSEDLRQKFSKRTEAMEALLPKLREQCPHLSEVELRQKAVLESRQKKTPLSREEFHQRFEAQLSAEQRRELERIVEKARAREGMSLDSPLSEREAMRLAVKDCFERASVVTKNQLLAAALFFGMGRVRLNVLEQLVEERPFIKAAVDSGEVFYTTVEVLREEDYIIQFVREGRGSCLPFRERFTCFNSKLSTEQKVAVQYILLSRDRVIGLRGKAGAGKTTLMKEVVEGLENGGFKVFAFAPSAEASRGVLRSEGFKNANTLAHLFQNEKLQEQVSGNVIWVDEAGLVSTRQMCRLFHFAETHGCRVILTGDYKQHAAVERGDAYRLLEGESGMKVTSLDENRRQLSEAYRAAVNELSNGKVREAFLRLMKMDAIHEVQTESRYEMLAKDYVQAVVERKTALVISPTHAEGDHVTERIREELKQRSLIRGAEHTVTTLKPLAWTEAQRSHAGNYEPGKIIQFEQNMKGFARGERVTISDVRQEGVFVQKQDGTVAALPLERAGQFQVYEKQAIPVAVGDKIRITHNGWDNSREHRLSNGSIHEVKAIHKNEIELKNGAKISTDFGHLSHGYCVTSHAAQGKTVDRVFIAENAWSARVAGSREQFYVSVSRGREEVKIYTDDKQALLEGIAPSSARLTAHELLSPSVRLDILEQIRQQYRASLENPAEAPKQKEEITEKITPQMEQVIKERERYVQNINRFDINPNQSRGIRPGF